MGMKLFCDRPDIHLPRVLCNQPLPCKFHGGLRGRMVHFEDARHFASRSNGLPLVAPRLFATRIGPRWRAIAEQFLPLLLH